MAEMGGEVWSVEIVEEFAEGALARFAALHYDIQVRVGDGSRGWADHAPFDRILVTAAAAEVPPTLIEQLRPGGRMIIPLGGQDVQQLSMIGKDVDDEVTTRAIMPVRFTQLEMATEPPAPV
jgi:protein-L-isoaspartate(D-aspartate) O-methyltransferase